MMVRHAPVLIPLLFLFGALLAPLVGRRRAAWSRAAALAASAAASAVSVIALVHVATEGTVRYRLGGWAPSIGIEYVLDPLAAFLSVIICAAGFFVLVHGGSPVRRELPGRESPFYAMALLLLFGLSGIVVTGDAFNFYVFLEISSLAGYALIGVGDRPGPVAAFRYLLLGTLGASFYLLGVGFLYMATGTLNMGDLAAAIPVVGATPIIVVGLALIAAGLALKMALFPMHGWLPDAYTFAPSTTSALLASVGTKVAAYGLLRFLFYVFPLSYVTQAVPVTGVVLWLSAVAIIVGSVMAIAQGELKRMLAYSSVAQVGYIGLGIGLANPLGFVGAVLHILNHAVMKGALFLVAANLRTRLGHSQIDALDDDIRHRMPWTMAAFTVAALSMVGIPPTAGFFSKWYLALGILEKGQGILLAVIVVSSLLNAVYFWRVLERVYLAAGKAKRKVELQPELTAPVGAAMIVPTLLLAFGLLALGLANAWIVETFIRPMLPGGLG